MPAAPADAKAWARERVTGLWTTPMIPMKPNGDIDTQGIRDNVDHIIGLRAGGIGFGFSEPWYLTLEERMSSFKVFVDAVDKRIPCYVHAVDYSVPETIRLVRYCTEIGADAVMLWVPMEFTKSEAMACDWYEYVASRVSVPMFVYNTYHSGRNLSIQAIERLATLENVCALKDAVNDYGHTIEAMRAVGEQLVVSNPLEEYLPAMMIYSQQQVLLGATSVFLMQSPKCPAVQQYVDLINAGDHAGGWAAYFALQPLRDVWKSIYAELWNHEAAQHPIALIKCWMDLLGMSGGVVRPPLRQLSAEDAQRFEATLERTGWLERLVSSRALATP